MSAGTSVIATTSDTSTVSAIPGPKSRKNASRPAMRAAVPPATISPAVTTIGRYCAVASWAASTRSAPASSCSRIPCRKKIP